MSTHRRAFIVSDTPFWTNAPPCHPHREFTCTCCKSTGAAHPSTVLWTAKKWHWVCHLILGLLAVSHLWDPAAPIVSWISLSPYMCKVSGSNPGRSSFLHVYFKNAFLYLFMSWWDTVNWQWEQAIARLHDLILLYAWFEIWWHSTWVTTSEIQFLLRTMTCGQIYQIKYNKCN